MVTSAVTEQQAHSRRDRDQRLDSCLKGEPHMMPSPVMLLIGRCLYFATFRTNCRRNHIAIAIAESDDLVALHLLVPAEADVVAAFLRRCRRTIAMDDRGIEEIGFMKLQHRACKHGVKTAICLHFRNAL